MVGRRRHHVVVAGHVVAHAAGHACLPHHHPAGHTVVAELVVKLS